MNPCPVYDERQEKIFLFYICVPEDITERDQIKNHKNAAHLCYITSINNGDTWTKPTELDYVIGDWATFAVGPGHGIQRKDGTLIIPAYAYHICTSYCCCYCCCCCTSYSLAFCSVDNGNTWQKVEKLDLESNECQIAEIMDDKREWHLYCNARNCKKNGTSRVEAWNGSNQQAFDRCELSQLRETGSGCQGSVLSFAPKSTTSTWLLHSHPTDKSQRINLGIYLNKSPFSSNGWEKPWIIHQGPSGYSDLCQNENEEDFACLMECGKVDYWEEIVFVEFSLSDVSAEIQ
ncbi:sialidase-3-like isoform X2 [Brachyhypopomus gauderio]